MAAGIKASSDGLYGTLQVNSADIVTFNSSGNVGIGTSSPTVKLQINAGNGNQAVFNNAGERYTQVNWQNTGANKGAIWVDNTNSLFEFYGYSGVGMTFSTSGTERARIDSSGNLLVGTTSSSGSGASSGKQVIQFNGAAENGIYIDDTRTSSGIDNGIIFGRGANFIGSIDTDLTLFRIRAGGDLVFAANSAEKARIDTNGNLMVGTTTPRGMFTSQDSGSVTGLINTNATASSGTRYHAVWYETGVERGSVTSAGGGVAYNSASDYRLKEAITPMTGALARVAALKPVTYTWKNSGAAGEGFIAHELQEVCPVAVTREKDAVDAEGNPQYQGIDTSFLVATLTAAIQEQQAIIEDMKTRLAAAGI